MKYTHECVQMIGAKTKNGADMWRCLTKDNITFFVFTDGKRPGTLKLFNDYIPLMVALDEGQVLRWTEHPVPVALYKDGAYWNVEGVAPMPIEAEPDTLFQPDAKLARAAARQWARAALDNDVVIWDSETTDANPLSAEIVSLAAIDGSGNELIKTWIKPQDVKRLVDSGASEVNGITPAMLTAAPTFADVYPAISAALGGRNWIIYHAAFDTVVLERDCFRNGCSPIVPLGTTCAMEMFARWNGEWDLGYQQFKYKKLSEAAAQFGVATDEAHDALFDCQMTLKLIQKMAE